MTLIDQYCSHQTVRGFSQATIRRRRFTLRRWVAHVDLAEATTIDVETFLAHWRSAQSRKSILSDLRTFYRWATTRNLLPDDPTTLVDPIKVPHRAPSPVPAVDVLRLVKSTSGVDHTMVMLAAYAGLRVSEIAALGPGDIDFAGRRITVRRGKGGSDTHVPIADELLDELNSWQGVRWNGATVSRHIRQAMRASGIAGRPHDLRHSFGTYVAQRTHGDAFTTQRLMRHADITSTQRYVAWNTSGHEVVSGLYGEVA